MNSFEMRFSNATVVICVALLCGCETNQQRSVYNEPSRPLSEAEFTASLPDDVDPVSRGRIPLVNRDDLDDARKPAYDARVAPDTKSLAGLHGPGGLGLNGSADLGETLVDKRTQELARLVVSREMDQAFEWTVHEPVALKAGLEPEIIDVIRYRRSLAGLPEREAAIIQWGRELFQEHRVSSETFARVKAQLSTRDIVDLCHFMGNYTRTAILLHTFDVHLPYDRPPLLPLR